MSIKRRATGGTKPAAKAVVSSTRGRPEILPAQKMVAGTEYVGWLCRNKACGLLMAIADVAVADPSQGPPPIKHEPDHTPVIKCPHCQNEDLYRWNSRERRVYVPKPSDA